MVLPAVNIGDKKVPGITFTEALERTKFGKFNCLVIFASGLVLANVLLESAGVSFILPIAQCGLDLSNRDKGLLSAISYVGIICSSHLWGFLADTKGRRKVILPTLLIGFVVTVFSSFANKFWIMVLLRFINGFCISGGSATIYAYLGEFHTDKTRPRANMGSAFIFALGAMILPLIAFLVINGEWSLPIPFLGIDYKPWRLFLVVCGIPGFLCGLLLYAVPESPKFLLSVGREAECIEVLQKMLRWNGGKEELKISHIYPEENALGLKTQSLDNTNFFKTFIQTMWNQTVPLFHRTYLRTTLIVCIIQFWLYVATNGLYVWFPTIINNMAEFIKEHPDEHKQICQIVYEKHLSSYKTDGSMECITKLENHTYLYSLIMEITYASSFIVIGAVINCIGKISILFITMILFPVCGLVALFITDPSIAAYLYVLFFLVGVAINVLGGATVELYPTRLRGMAICISLMIGRLGSVAGANIAGALLSNNCAWTFYITCSALISCAFLSLLLPKKGIDEVSKENKQNGA